MKNTLSILLRAGVALEANVLTLQDDLNVMQLVNRKSQIKNQRSGCRTWIRTMTDCSRGSRATITPFGIPSFEKLNGLTAESSKGLSN